MQTYFSISQSKTEKTGYSNQHPNTNLFISYGAIIQKGNDGIWVAHRLREERFIEHTPIWYN